MSPSLVQLSAALLACASSVSAVKYSLAETYDHTNFFDKFNFFESKFGTGNNNDVDPNSGYVNYQSKTNAMSKGYAAIQNNQVYLGVDHKTVTTAAQGRQSINLKSKTSYKHGLFIARFTHLPEAKCGAWPAFWTIGDNWPNTGEFDIYEHWNNEKYNQPALHTGSSGTYGQCVLDGTNATGTVTTPVCDNTYQNPPAQYLNQGCAVTDTKGPWGAVKGGTFALEWTSDFIKIYTWFNDNKPANINTTTPDTSVWGTPAVYLKNNNCNIDKHFGPQYLRINIDFCGNPAGDPNIWAISCKAKTGQATCADYVQKKPGDFANVYFVVKDIRYFKTASTTAAVVTSKKAATPAKPTTTKKTTLAKTTSAKKTTSTKKATATKKASN